MKVSDYYMQMSFNHCNVTNSYSSSTGSTWKDWATLIQQATSSMLALSSLNPNYLSLLYKHTVKIHRFQNTLIYINMVFSAQARVQKNYFV